MTPATIDAAARLLADTRRNGALLDGLPPEMRPGTIADGYRVQEAFIGLWKGEIVGWKIGATAKAIMDRFGLAEPFVGPCFAADTLASPARPSAAANPHLCIEAEIAFRMGKTLAPRAEPYTRADVVAAVGAVLPAYEVVGPRFRRILFDQAPTIIGDCSLNAAMVLGADVTDWTGIELAKLQVPITVDGKLKWTGSGAAVMGDPINVLEWTANHLSKRGIPLKAGEFVSTGATAGLMFLEPGEVCVSDFGPLGKIEIAFAGPRSSETVQRP